jgi:glycosyltransferase involved in cell wall biosynthesis
LHHLQQTLPLWVSQAPDQIVVVDYGCPQGTGDWVESTYPDVTVVRVTDDASFHISRARNLGAAQVTADWICFIDADVRTRPGWVAWMRARARDGAFYQYRRLRRRADETIRWDALGTVVCPRQAYQLAGGYDETIAGWGCEDRDFYHRLHLVGFAPRYYPNELVDPIEHGDTERLGGSRQGRHLSQIKNRLYFEAKKIYLSAFGLTGDLPAEQKAAIMKTVTGAMNAQVTNPNIPEMTLNLNLSGYYPALSTFRIRKEIKLTFTVELPRDPVSNAN